MGLQVNYSPLDQFIHKVAFSTPAIQTTAADLERMTFGRVYGRIEAGRPIFITSLPRAGTTVLLEVLHRSTSLASHTYRDMPFVMAPILWSRLSGPFRKRDELRERAHKDGMQIGYDSPEAFEEVLWRYIWPEKYCKTRLVLWDAADEKNEARSFFVEHMKKIILLRKPDRADDGRYLSKNNNNLARLDLIGEMFPGAKILVPVRDPLEHTASLLRQHRNFIALHEAEPFVRRYMADVGHFEFGDLHRPIAFPGLDALIADRDPLTVDYWLGYWIAAFEYVLERCNSVLIVSLEAACANPCRALADIYRQLEIRDDAMVDKVAPLLRAPSRQSHDQDAYDPRLLDRAKEIYSALIHRSVARLHAPR